MEERMSESNDENRPESNSTAWFVGIIVALALLAIGYLVFSANSQPKTVKTSSAPTLELQFEPAAA